MTEAGDQREFLLRSIEDLEREHDAGDLDDDDYRLLRDDYTARAAAALRAERRDARRGGPRRTGLVVLAGVVAFAIVAGVLVAQASGRRDPGDTATGDIAQSTTQKLNEAQGCFAGGDAECALGLYDEILAEDPSNAEALTYKGWALYTLEDDAQGALDLLVEAAERHPEYPDVHAFLAVVFFRLGLVGPADAALDQVEELDPRPDLLRQIEGLRAEVDAALAAASTTTTAG